MRVVVLGGGMQGTACAYDLCRSDDVREVLIADLDINKAEQSADAVQKALKANSADARNMSQISGKVDRMFKISAESVDVKQHTRLVSFLRQFDVAVSAVPYFFNVGITKACIDSETHMVDMGGNTDVVFEQRALHDKAKAAGVTILPDCGLAPGMANILAADGIAQLDKTNSVAIRVGGLPQYPVAPLNYQLFFSIHGLINEYLGKAVILENGKRKTVDTLTDIETLRFAGFDDEFEAAITLGGLSTLPWTYENRIQSLTYKTIRYPGHWSIIQGMEKMGVFDETPIKTAGGSISPRELFAKAAESRLSWKAQGGRPEDVVLVRVTVKGEKGVQAQTLLYEIVDRFEPATGFTAMMRTTAYPVSIVAQMLGKKTIRDRGVLALENAVPTGAFIEALKQRRINVYMAVNEGAGVG